VFDLGERLSCWSPQIESKRRGQVSRCAARDITPALMALPLWIRFIPCSITRAYPSALVSVAVAAEGAEHIGQMESSLSRLAFVLIKVLMTRCLHVLCVETRGEGAARLPVIALTVVITRIQHAMYRQFSLRDSASQVQRLPASRVVFRSQPVMTHVRIRRLAPMNSTPGHVCQPTFPAGTPFLYMALSPSVAVSTFRSKNSPHEPHLIFSIVSLRSANFGGTPRLWVLGLSCLMDFPNNQDVAFSQPCPFPSSLSLIIVDRFYSF
jgi:hypothetical protein